MGLESATYVSDLLATNPVVGDNVSQGDDHLRLIKAALQSTLPNASRAFRFPSALSKSANYTVLATDENAVIFCDPTGGAFTLTLPTPTFGGWGVRVVKSTYSTNPVFVSPPSGSIVTPGAAVTKVRCDVPSSFYDFVWSGGSFYCFHALSPAGNLEYTAAPSVPVGYGVSVGQSLLRADYPELFAIWGTGYGAADGTHFSAPNTINRFPVAAGSTYVLGAQAGAASATIAQANLPDYTLPNTLGVSDTRVWKSTNTQVLQNVGGLNGSDGFGFKTANDAAQLDIVVTGGSISLTGGVTLGGSGAAMAIIPPYHGLYQIFRLC